MIISVHIPKTAGTSFGHELTWALNGRVFRDYGDWPEVATPEARANDERRRLEMLDSAGRYRQEFDAIHGHFTSAKYRDVFPHAALVTFVRDPYQHAISSYEHAARVEWSAHAGYRAFQEQGMTLLDLVRAFPNHQSVYFEGATIEDFAVVGITERYEQSIALFEAVCGVSMPRGAPRLNVNPRRAGEYPVTDELRRAVEQHRAADIDLHRRANERLTTLCRVYGV